MMVKNPGLYYQRLEYVEYAEYVEYVRICWRQMVLERGDYISKGYMSEVVSSK